ncbi:MAG TPA: AsmA family protein, partial [Burkholderiales bacterium]|nr:AsmA family protein [Burkholderiales bacterium]
SADGRRNWILERNQKRSDDPPVIERLTVDSGTFVYRNPAHATNLTVAIATDSSVEEGRQTRVSARGLFRGLKASAEGTGGPVLNLRDKTSPYPLDVRAQLGSTSASAKGAVTGLVALSEVNLSMSLQGANLRQLGSILEIVLPATPKYSVAGQLVRNGRTWKFTEFEGSLGKSDLSGSIEFERESERPMLRADLQSRQLFLDELKRESKEPPQFARLRGFDADVKLAAQMAKREQRSIGGLTAHLRLDHGELKIDPLDFAAASGTVNSSLTLNARNDPPSARAAVKVSSIQLDSLFPKAKGTLAGSADLAGHGQSFEAMLGSSGGDVQFAISDGEISQLLVSLVGLNATGLFRSLIGERERIPVNCAVGDFKVQDGVMRTEALVIDTDKTDMAGAGTINLKNKTYDLTFTPLEEKEGIFSRFLPGGAPVHVSGTFKNPRFSSDATGIATRGGAALALGVINPLAALIPLLAPGSEKDANCAALMQKAGN